MPHNLSREQSDALEAMIDGASLRAVVAALADIALDKAEHIRTNWQDGATAGPWTQASKRLDIAANALEV
jgi:hypothetical protein